MPRIMVIDDDRIVLKLIESELSRRGYEVDAAQDGASGLQRIQQSPPDIILIDRYLPDIGGDELIRRLRRDPHTSALPILMITGSSSIEGKLAAFEAGADDYLQKPFVMDELAARLTALLRRMGIRPEAALAEEEGRNPSRLIAIHSVRGGVGKTTLAVNLANALGNLWQLPTLLVDMVMVAGQVPLFLNKQTRRTWADVAEYAVEDIDLDLVERIITHWDGALDFIAAPIRPDDAEQLQSGLITRTFDVLRPAYEYTVVDLPQDFSETTLRLLDQADTIILMATPELASVRAAALALDTYSRLGYDEENIRLVVNWTFQRGGIATTSIEKTLRHPVSMVIPFASKYFVPAINQGTPLIVSEPEHPISALIEDFAFRNSKQVHREIPPAAPSPMWQRVNDRLRVFNLNEKNSRSRLKINLL